MAKSNSRPKAAATRRSTVQEEIRQGRAFRSRAQEATVALLRTASVVGRAIARVLEPSGLSLAQYNALRIVRGAPRSLVIRADAAPRPPRRSSRT